MLDAHPVHVQSPVLGVKLIHFGTTHFKLQTWGQDSLHSLLHSVVTPVSAAQYRVNFIKYFVLRYTAVDKDNCLKG